jgi:hypothetical protein
MTYYVGYADTVYEVFDIFGRELKDGDLVICPLKTSDNNESFIKGLGLLLNHHFYLYNSYSHCFKEYTNFDALYVYNMNYNLLDVLNTTDLDIESIPSDLSVFSDFDTEPVINIGDFVCISADGMPSDNGIYGVSVSDSIFYTGKSCYILSNVDFVYKIQYMTEEEKSIKETLLSSYQEFALKDIIYKDKGESHVGDAFVLNRHLYLCLCLDTSLYLKVPISDYYSGSEINSYYVEKIYSNILKNNYSNKLISDYLEYSKNEDITSHIDICFKYQLPQNMFLHYIGTYNVYFSNELRNQIFEFDAKMKAGLAEKFRYISSLGIDLSVIWSM